MSQIVAGKELASILLGVSASWPKISVIEWGASIHEHTSDLGLPLVPKYCIIQQLMNAAAEECKVKIAQYEYVCHTINSWVEFIYYYKLTIYIIVYVIHP